MKTSNLETSKAYVTNEIIEYIPNAVVIKTILKKPSGNISIISFDKGEGLIEKTSPFDTFIQIVEGSAEIVIRGESNILQVGQSILVPAHEPSLVKPNGRFKMIQTVIKSGYE